MAKASRTSQASKSTRSRRAAKSGSQAASARRSAPSKRSEPVEQEDADAYDFERLERAVRVLLKERRRLEAENQSLRCELAEKDVRVKGLDAKLIEFNQRRVDAKKRLDDLIARVGDFDPESPRTRG